MAGELVNVIKNRAFHVRGTDENIKTAVAVRNGLLQMLDKYLVNSSDILEFRVDPVHLSDVIDATTHSSIESRYTIRQVSPEVFQAHQRSLESAGWT